MKQIRRYCKSCGEKTLFGKHCFGMGWGCLLTILTAGLFIPLWLLLGVMDMFKPYRCQRCGKGHL